MGFPIETQEQFDEMVKERVDRAKRSAIPEDYEDLKAKAARLDEIEEQGTVELRKAREEAAAAQRELEALRARDERLALARKVAKAKGVPAELVHGSTEEEMEGYADQLIKWSRPGAAPKVARPGAHDAGASTDKDSGTDAAKRQLAAMIFGGSEE